MTLNRYGKTTPHKKWDVIVVLGAKVRADGTPSPALRRRALHAVKLVLDGISDVLLLSGGVVNNSPSEASVMRRLAVEHGVRGDQIVMEETARSTLDSAMACSRIIFQNRWATVLIVTDGYHLIRSVLLLRLFGVNTHWSAPKYPGFTPRRWKWWSVQLREWMALPWSMLRALMIKMRNDPLE